MVSGAAGTQPKAAGMEPKAEPDQAWLARGLASTGSSAALPGQGAAEPLVALETSRRKELWSRATIRVRGPAEAQAGGEGEQCIVLK